MSHPPSIQTNINLSRDFSARAASIQKKQKPKKPHTTTVSFRVTEAEKNGLEVKAGSLSLGAYARQELFGDSAEQRPKRYRNKPKTPPVDYVMLAQVLGKLGESELATSMFMLSLAAQSGELDVSPEVSGRLESACDAIHEMKITLITALNIKPQES